MATRRDISNEILAYLRQQQAVGVTECSPETITAGIDAPRPTVNRHLATLAANQVVRKLYAGPATRYALPNIPPVTPAPTESGFKFNEANQALIDTLVAPIGTRTHVSYKRDFVESYVPNQTSLLPVALAEELLALGRARGQQPAGTYARKVLEQLLIDLSWQSSRLEGNRKSWLDTKLLFERGHGDENDVDALMLLNHKEAIEFIVDAVPEYGISEAVVRNLQSVLMQGLLDNPEALGQTRRSVVNITDSVYLPLQIPQQLEELLAQIIEKTCNIKNPVEASFFLWLNIAYLQPFEDGNKRSSRLCANLPLLLQNCAPLAFLDVEQADYALAVLGVYEQQNPALAVDLFEWTYRRSVAKYAAILESLGAPDQFRQRYRERLGDGVRQVVAERIALDEAVAVLGIPPEDNAAFKAALHQELTSLAVFNCARYRLGLNLTERWIADGRPGL